MDGPMDIENSGATGQDCSSVDALLPTHRSEPAPIAGNGGLSYTAFDRDGMCKL